MGEDFSEEAIREHIGSRAGSREKRAPAEPAALPLPVSTPYKPSLLIDIQQKIKEGKGAGYARWASRHNLKLMAKTLLYGTGEK